MERKVFNNTDQEILNPKAFFLDRDDIKLTSLTITPSENVSLNQLKKAVFKTLVQSKRFDPADCDAVFFRT